MTVGLSSEDELATSHMVQRESYICQANWSTSNNVDDILFTSNVTPSFFDNDNGTYAKLYMTPMGMLSQIFQEWRGDIIFRFRFVCSQYHKGRVRISYDPAGYSAENIFNDVTTSSVVHTQIVDLGKDADVEIRVPYQQAASWLLSSQGIGLSNRPWTTNSAASWTMNPGFHNGAICMRVMTALTAPVASSTIQIFVSVRGGENLEFANPCDPPQTTSTWAVQCGDTCEDVTICPEYRPSTPRPMSRQAFEFDCGKDMEEERDFFSRHWKRLQKLRRQKNDVIIKMLEENFKGKPKWSYQSSWIEQADSPNEPTGELRQQLVAGAATGNTEDLRYRVNFGEAVASLRSVMRRYALSYVYLNNTADANVLNIALQTQSKYPLAYGFDPNGLHTAKGLVATTTTFPFNYTNTTVYNWIAPCFIAQRGSMNWIFNVDCQSSIQSIRAYRTPSVAGTVSNTFASTSSGSDSANTAYLRGNGTLCQPGCGGQALTSQWTNAGLNVTLPNYTQYRWQNTAPGNATAPNSLDGSDKDFSTFEVSFENSGTTEKVKTKIWKYVGIGTDYGCYFFLNVPTRIIYGADPVPV
jgi:hypothetical protein